MQISTKKVSEIEDRGKKKKTKYGDVYERARNLQGDDALVIDFDSKKKALRLYNAARQKNKWTVRLRRERVIIIAKN